MASHELCPHRNFRPSASVDGLAGKHQGTATRMVGKTSRLRSKFVPGGWPLLWITSLALMAMPRDFVAYGLWYNVHDSGGRGSADAHSAIRCPE